MIVCSSIKFGPDEGLASLASVAEEFAALGHDPSLSEADTRAKLIDMTLRNVLGWPERLIERERNTRGERARFYDYKLALASVPYVLVEAKATYVDFPIPAQRGKKRYLLRTLLTTDEVLKDAILQVRGYCDDLGCRYAVATNGKCWIVFRATRQGMNWRDGDARVFWDLQDIQRDFWDFWNLLSYDAVHEGIIEREFSEGAAYVRRQDRVLTRLFKADQPLERNRLHAQLDRFIEAFFKDIADQEYTQILERCYVYSSSLSSNYIALRNRIEASVPRFLEKEGILSVQTGKKDSGVFQGAMHEKVENVRGELILVLGGIGAGKTTFLKRYFRLTDAEFLDRRTAWFYTSLLGPPLDAKVMESFIWNSVLQQVRSKYGGIVSENRRTLKSLYARELDLLWETQLSAEGLPQEEVEKRISPKLELWQSDVQDYVPRLVRLLRERDRVPIICLDNVDQLPVDLQASLFLAAQAVARKSDAITILSLREETYFAARIRRTFTAYSNQKFHIGAPNFLVLIGKRLQAAREALSLPAPELKLALRSGIDLDKESLSAFLSIVEQSVFKYNKMIVRFIQSTCFGDMRLALGMFAMFLISGATDIDKMLRIMKRDGSYYVPFHEFLKSIMLGDRTFYREEDSPILNVFQAGVQRNSSHFTCLRILRFLLLHRNDVVDEGRGYMPLVELLPYMDGIFDNRNDIVHTLNRLVRKGLVEANTHSREGTEDASHVRVTAAGWYYSRYLIYKFVYLDLALIDTPIDDPGVAEALFQGTLQIIRFPENEESKQAKTEARFRRTELFIGYLRRQEQAELQANPRIQASAEFAEPFVDKIESDFGREREWIRSRIRENIERYRSDLDIFDVSALDAETSFVDEVTVDEETASPAAGSL